MIQNSVESDWSVELLVWERVADLAEGSMDATLQDVSSLAKEVLLYRRALVLSASQLDLMRKKNVD